MLPSDIEHRTKCYSGFFDNLLIGLAFMKEQVEDLSPEIVGHPLTPTFFLVLHGLTPLLLVWLPTTLDRRSGA
jgi:hypothetical protein